jgi:hypothetical protein
MIVAGIDQSLTRTGLAGLRNGRPVMLESVNGHSSLHVENWDAADHVKDWDHRVRRIASLTNAITTRLRDKIGIPDLTAIEAPLTFGTQGTSDSYDRYTLFVGICAQLIAWDAPYVVVHNQTRARWATGHGSAAKRAAADRTGSTKRREAKTEVFEAVRTTWAPWKQHIANDDIADALVLAEICARRLDEPLHFRIRLHQVEAMHTSIKWPPSIPCAKPDNQQVGAQR